MSLETTLDATLGEAVVDFHIQVTNVGQEAVTLRFRTGQRFDVIVTEADTGKTVWRWSAGRLFTQAITHITLTPDETLSDTLTWSDPPTGTYEATGVLKADNGVSATTTVVVE